MNSDKPSAEQAPAGQFATTGTVEPAWNTPAGQPLDADELLAMEEWAEQHVFGRALSSGATLHHAGDRKGVGGGTRMTNMAHYRELIASA